MSWNGVNNLQSEKAGPVGIRVAYSRSPFVDCQARRLNDGQKKQIGVILLDARGASVKYLVGGTRCASRVEPRSISHDRGFSCALPTPVAAASVEVPLVLVGAVEAAAVAHRGCLSVRSAQDYPYGSPA